MKYFKSKKALHISFAAYLLSNLLRVAAAAALNNLQTSLNIKDGMGATTVLVAYITSLIFGTFIGPIILGYFGCKVGIVMGSIAISLYILTNMYANYYILLPGALCFGIGRALFWVSSGTFIVVYSFEYSSLNTEKANEYFSLVNALQFGSVQSSQIFGNLITFAILSLSSTDTDSNENFNVTKTFSSTFSTDLLIKSRIGEVCGANDCQNPNVTDENLSNYVTPTQTTRFVIMGVLTSLCLLGAVLSVIFLPNATGKNNNKAEAKDRGNVNKAYDSPPKDIRLKRIPQAASQPSEDRISQTNEPDDFENESSFPETNLSAKKTLKEVLKTLKQFLKPYQLLLAPFQMQAGLNLGFITGEVTRAYVSCVYGVAKVGICMCFYGASSVCSSLLAGRISGKLGRKYAIAFSFVISVIFYSFCLLWIPNENSSIGIAFALLLIGGSVEAFSRTMSSEVTLAHFADEKMSAYVCWFVWMTIGMLTQYGWSTSLCVRTKIYVMFCSLTLAIVTCSIAEYLYEKRLKDGENKSSAD